MTDSNLELSSEPTSPSGPKKLWLKVPAAIIAFCIIFEVLFLAWNWFVPPWGDIREGKIPPSALIKDYQDKKDDDPKLPALRWKPIVKAVPKNVSHIFILAEDSRFYEHDGFDYEAIAAAMQYNWKKGKVLRGASTISQQTAKNLFLSLSRNPLRKWHEVLLTYMLEAKLSKAQILHAYLNIAEFGTGIYGIEAAAQAYFHRSASSLSQDQAIMLAATLPSPKKHNPGTQTRAFQQRHRRVATAIRMVDQYAAIARGKKESGATSALPTDAELAEKLREVMADPNAEKAEVEAEAEAEANEQAASDKEASPPVESPAPKEETLSGEALEAQKSENAPPQTAPASAETPADPIHAAADESPPALPPPAAPETSPQGSESP
ncbi:MAG: monofunctional biosynthetic peptidoglycan transglycosylase [Oligoflexus sp.]|nr:monofunctional biosynthetic peptidoglycan transglycosylase [Oligoflexus sp.]